MLDAPFPLRSETSTAMLRHWTNYEVAACSGVEPESAMSGRVASAVSSAQYQRRNTPEEFLEQWLGSTCFPVEAHGALLRDGVVARQGCVAGTRAHDA